MNEARLTPFGEFVARLPLGWRCFDDPVRAVATLLHDSGLWFEVTTIFEPDEAATVAVLDALAAAVASGATGRHVVVEKRAGAMTARTEPVLARPIVLDWTERDLEFGRLR